MEHESPEGLPAACERALGKEERELLHLLCGFTQERLRAAARGRQKFLEAHSAGDSEAESASLHAFLRESWEVLDGLGREVNVCMHRVFPLVGLYRPGLMTRQCTFYVVRKKLCEHRDSTRHPVSRLLWDSTHGASRGAYERLSFLYNLSLFLPVSLVGERELPGGADLPAAAWSLVKPSSLERRSAPEGVTEIVEWLESLVAECRARLAAALEGVTR